MIVADIFSLFECPTWRTAISVFAAVTAGADLAGGGSRPHPLIGRNSPTTHGSGSVVIAGNGPTTAATRTRRLGTAGVWELYGLQRSLRCAAM
jgi:hypothetical protein